MIKTSTTISTTGPARPRIGQTDQTGRQFRLRSLHEPWRAPHQRQKHHGRHDAGRGMGTTVEIETDGPQEQQAMDALLALINDKFGEGE